jgi:serine/threonine protein kinase
MPSDSARDNQDLVLKVVVPIVGMLSLAMAIFGLVLWRGKHKRESISLSSFSTTFPKVSFKDLARATQGFSISNLIGSGGYSSVYQGKLDEIEIAVKVFNLQTRGAQQSFISECNALRNVRHRNLVKILTACSSIDSNGNDFKALVYELMAGGDLHKLLYSTRDYESSSNLNLLTLVQRMNIMVDVADAMEYLHHNNQGIVVHCDLKPSNILLDDNMIAHVGDFGLAIFKAGSASSSLGNLDSSSVGPMGTIGYAAPGNGLSSMHCSATV